MLMWLLMIHSGVIVLEGECWRGRWLYDRGNFGGKLLMGLFFGGNNDWIEIFDMIDWENEETVKWFGKVLSEIKVFPLPNLSTNQTALIYEADFITCDNHAIQYKGYTFAFCALNCIFQHLDFWTIASYASAL